jgi:hypothetical protein
VVRLKSFCSDAFANLLSDHNFYRNVTYEQAKAAGQFATTNRQPPPEHDALDTVGLGAVKGVIELLFGKWGEEI